MTELDITTLEFAQNPYPHYEALRASGPVQFLKNLNRFLVIGYKETIEILGNTETFPSAMNASFDPVLLGADGQKHADHRRALEGTKGPFSKSRIQGLEGRIREICLGLLDPLRGRKDVDLLADFGTPLPSLVILDVLGISPENSKDLREWTFTAVSNASIYNLDFSANHWTELKPFLEELIDKCYQQPRPGVMSELVWSENTQSLFAREQLIDLAKILLVGGNETTPNLIGSAALIMLRDPELMRRVREDLGLVTNLINETLRHQSPTQMVHRSCAVDTVVGGVTIPAGSVVAVCIGAANRDPEQFPDPDRFDIHRQQSKMIPFGYGPHVCIGAGLAKLEAIVAVEELFKAFPNWSTNIDLNALTYRNSSHVRGLNSLPISIQG